MLICYVRSLLPVFFFAVARNIPWNFKWFRSWACRQSASIPNAMRFACSFRSIVISCGWAVLCAIVIFLIPSSLHGYMCECVSAFLSSSFHLQRKMTHIIWLATRRHSSWKLKPSLFYFSSFFFISFSSGYFRQIKTIYLCRSLAVFDEIYLNDL